MLEKIDYTTGSSLSLTILAFSSTLGAQTIFASLLYQPLLKYQHTRNNLSHFSFGIFFVTQHTTSASPSPAQNLSLVRLHSNNLASDTPYPRSQHTGRHDIGMLYPCRWRVPVHCFGARRRSFLLPFGRRTWAALLPSCETEMLWER
jgi:hypothetical protein